MNPQYRIDLVADFSFAREEAQSRGDLRIAAFTRVESVACSQCVTAAARPVTTKLRKGVYA